MQPDGSTSNEPRADAPHISVLHLFSGKSKHVWPDDNEETLATIIKKYGRSYFKDCPAGLNIHVVEVDYLNCGCYDDVTQRFAGFCRNPSRLPCCNLMANGMFNFLLKEAKRGKYQCVIAGIPCNGYSVVRFEEGGARPLRDRGHLLGLPHLSESDRASLAMSNALTVRSLAICLAIWESGGEVVIENPIDYGTFGLWATNPRTGELDEAYNAKRLRPRHAPIWLMPSMRSFLQAVQAVLLHFAECQLGSDFQKYTTLAATPGWILVASALAAFDNVPCRCSKPHARRACGRDANGDYASAEAARYPDGSERTARRTRRPCRFCGVRLQIVPFRLSRVRVMQ